MIEAREVYLKGIEGNTRLQGCSVSARSGEAVAVVGQRGSGKSTLLQVLAGVLVPDKGSFNFRVIPGLRGRTAFLGGFIRLSSLVQLVSFDSAAKALKPGNRVWELERFSCGFVERLSNTVLGQRVLDFIRVMAGPVLAIPARVVGF